MSLCISRRTWYSLILFSNALVFAVSGCSTATKGDSLTNNDESVELEALFSDLSVDRSVEAESERDNANETARAILAGPVPLTVVENTSSKGESIDDDGGLGESSKSDSMLAAFSSVTVLDWEVVTGGTEGNIVTGKVDLSFSEPVSLAVRGEYLYVVDIGLNAVVRYDRATGRLDTVLDLAGQVAGEVLDIVVAQDFSFYLADSEGSRVLHFDSKGRWLKTYSEYFNLQKPVSIALLANGDLVVADGHYDHLVHFNAAGKLLATYGARGLDQSNEFLNIQTMAVGPDGYYVGARIGRKLKVLSHQGKYRYTLEQQRVGFPSAIVVDSSNRSYVSDLMDDVIKVFDRGRLVTTIGGHGTGLGKFKRVTDLWLDEQYLYVVDSLNARIQIAKIAP